MYSTINLTEHNANWVRHSVYMLGITNRGWSQSAFINLAIEQYMQQCVITNGIALDEAQAYLTEYQSLIKGERNGTGVEVGSDRQAGAGTERVSTGSKRRKVK